MEVSTLWKLEGQNATKPLIQNDTIDPASVSSWLKMHPSVITPASARFTSRIAWIELEGNSVHMSKENFDHVVKALGLEVAFKSTLTTHAGLQKLSLFDHGKGEDVAKYGFGIHPRFVLAWSHERVANLVQGVFLSPRHRIHQFQQLLELQWCQPVIILPLACATILSVEISNTQHIANEHVSLVGGRTGHHQWSSRPKASAFGPLDGLSAQMSGEATRMASTTRKVDLIEQILQFVHDSETTKMKPYNYTPQNGDMSLLRRRVAMQRIHAEFIRRRVEVQLTAVSGWNTTKYRLIIHSYST